MQASASSWPSESSGNFVFAIYERFSRFRMASTATFVKDGMHLSGLVSLYGRLTPSLIDKPLLF